MMDFAQRLAEFRHLIAPVQRMAQMMIARGVVTAVDDTAKTQEIQLKVFNGETLSGIERIQDYGFTSVPFPGAEAVIGSVQGNRTKSVALVVGDKRYRLTAMQGGEVALHDDQGQTIIIHRDRIELTSPTINLIASSQINLTAPQLTINGKTQTSDDVVIKGKSFLGHDHESNGAGAPTSAPL